MQVASRSVWVASRSHRGWPRGLMCRSQGTNYVQNAFWQSGRDSRWLLNKIICQNTLMACETLPLLFNIVSSFSLKFPRGHTMYWNQYKVGYTAHNVQFYRVSCKIFHSFSCNWRFTQSFIYITLRKKTCATDLKSYHLCHKLYFILHD